MILASTTDCTYDKATRTFVVEASTLQLRRSPSSIRLTNPVTGRGLEFFFKHNLVRDGEAVAAHYQAYCPRAKATLFLRLLND